MCGILGFYIIKKYFNFMEVILLWENYLKSIGVRRQTEKRERKRAVSQYVNNTRNPITLVVKGFLSICSSIGK